MNDKNIYEDEIDLREVGRIFKKRIWHIVILMTLAAGITGLATALLPETYTAQTEFYAPVDIGQQRDTFISAYTMEELAKAVNKEAVKEAKFNVTTDRSRDLLMLNVTSTDKERAAKLAGAWGYAYSNALERIEGKEEKKLKLLIDTMEKELKNYPKFRLLKNAEVKDISLLNTSKEDDIWKSAENNITISQETYPAYRAFEAEIVKEKIKLSRLVVKRDISNLQNEVLSSSVKADKDKQPIVRNVVIVSILVLLGIIISVFIKAIHGGNKDID